MEPAIRIRSSFEIHLMLLPFKASKLYLDLSHGNLQDDTELFLEVKAARKFLRSRIEVFSAAFNTLNAAPYKTLHSMKDSLKYLSLRGNNFADLLPDAEGMRRSKIHSHISYPDPAM